MTMKTKVYMPCQGAVPQHSVTDSQLRGMGFESIEIWSVSFTPLFLCFSEETIKAISAFYFMSVPGEVNDPTKGNVKKL